MILKDNKHSFISGNTPFIKAEPIYESQDSLCHKIVFESRHEGFMGIPHGGLAMGVCFDYFHRWSALEYPLRIDFKFGGSGLSIGESVELTMNGAGDNEKLTHISIKKKNDKKPYIHAAFSSSPTSESHIGAPLEPDSNFKDLPFYKNCFVCGHERKEPGLKRRFRYHHNSSNKETSVQWGFGSEDLDRAQSFLIGPEELHPAVILSIFDENTGWAGFMDTSSAGLSVKINLDLFRPVSCNEKLMFIGFPTGIKGNPKAPRFFRASGAVVSIDGNGAISLVASGQGEWIIMDKYTAQLRDNLYPRDDWAWIFPKK